MQKFKDGMIGKFLEILVAKTNIWGVKNWVDDITREFSSWLTQGLTEESVQYLLVMVRKGSRISPSDREKLLGEILQEAKAFGVNADQTSANSVTGAM